VIFSLDGGSSGIGRNAILLKLRLEVCIGELGIELISISNPSLCIGELGCIVLYWIKFEFYCLDNYALPFGIFITNPIHFPVCMHRRCSEYGLICH
jgi:hypothetical protein